MYIVVIFSYVYIYLCIKTLSQTGEIELEREWHFGHTIVDSVAFVIYKYTSTYISDLNSANPS